MVNRSATPRLRANPVARPRTANVRRMRISWKGDSQMSKRTILFAAAAGLISGLLGALYPALRAASQDPVDALSYE